MGFLDDFMTTARGAPSAVSRGLAGAYRGAGGPDPLDVLMASIRARNALSEATAPPSIERGYMPFRKKLGPVTLTRWVKGGMGGQMGVIPHQSASPTLDEEIMFSGAPDEAALMAFAGSPQTPLPSMPRQPPPQRPMQGPPAPERRLMSRGLPTVESLMPAFQEAVLSPRPRMTQEFRRGEDEAMREPIPPAPYQMPGERHGEPLAGWHPPMAEGADPGGFDPGQFSEDEHRTAIQRAIELLSNPPERQPYQSQQQSPRFPKTRNVVEAFLRGMAIGDPNGPAARAVGMLQETKQSNERDESVRMQMHIREQEALRDDWLNRVRGMEGIARLEKEMAELEANRPDADGLTPKDRAYIARQQAIEALPPTERERQQSELTDWQIKNMKRLAMGASPGSGGAAGGGMSDTQRRLVAVAAYKRAQERIDEELNSNIATEEPTSIPGKMRRRPERDIKAERQRRKRLPTRQEIDAARREILSEMGIQDWGASDPSAAPEDELDVLRDLSGKFGDFLSRVRGAPGP